MMTSMTSRNADMALSESGRKWEEWPSITFDDEPRKLQLLHVAVDDHERDEGELKVTAASGRG